MTMTSAKTLAQGLSTAGRLGLLVNAIAVLSDDTLQDITTRQRLYFDLLDALPDVEMDRRLHPETFINTISLAAWDEIDLRKSVRQREEQKLNRNSGKPLDGTL
ncbi:hypothetical protein [Aureimonas psammosilenae]|uniref:hypothetical protein n=1 Tax=Aureimonas psammosilenae TaxID=2495496 RepID=UPI001260D9AA|nr:hypothetical protein [Aureimonas psammosilenae]